MTAQAGAPAPVRIHRWRRGVAAVTLASGALQATFVPEMNLLGASLRLDGEEYLALPGGIGAYRIRHRGRRLSVLFGAGYPYAQVYAPPAAGFVCLEPMAAAAHALVAGGYAVVGPGASFTARFSIRPERLGPGTV